MTISTDILDHLDQLALQWQASIADQDSGTDMLGVTRFRLWLRQQLERPASSIKAEATGTAAELQAAITALDGLLQSHLDANAGKYSKPIPTATLMAQRRDLKRELQQLLGEDANALPDDPPTSQK